MIRGAYEEETSVSGSGQECALGQWFVLHTKSRQEKALAEHLERREIEFFLPLFRKVRYYGKRKVAGDLPLFPGYLFLRGTVEEAYAADRTDRVAHIIRVADQEMIDDELRQIRFALEQGGELVPRERMVKGMRVEVMSGPFKGLEGVIAEEHRDDRLILSVGMLGRAADLEIDRSLLRPVG